MPETETSVPERGKHAFTIEWWPTSRPVPYPKNARKLTDRAIDVVATSLKEYGWRQPIVVDRDGVVVAGHTRLAAAKKLGLELVPVHVAFDLTPEQIRAYRLMDNRSNEETSWDFPTLTIEMGELKGLNFDLALTGFKIGEINSILAPEAGLTADDSAPATPQTAVTVPGDLWLLGAHRVLAGDSTSVDAVARLCAPGLANLVFTDPPYNVDYEGYTEDKLKIQGDALPPEEFQAFLLSVFASYRTAVEPDAALYVCHPSSAQREFQAAIEAAGFEVRTQIIWAKNTFAWGFARYKFQHEPIFYCHLAKEADAWYGDKSQSTLWKVDKPAANKLHPTMKPVELVDMALVNSSKPGDRVLDLFGGSGSTLIACQKRERQALLMELDPKYVDVIVTRWQEFTGKQATLESSGETFAQLATARILGVAT